MLRMIIFYMKLPISLNSNSLLEETHGMAESLRDAKGSLDDAKATNFLTHPTQSYRFINNWRLFQDSLHNKGTVKG